MLKIDKTGVSTSKESIFGYSCRLWLLSWRRARVFARSCSLLSKYLPISWKQRKEQSHAQCHVTHRIRIFDKISEHVKVAKSVDIAVPELAVTSALPVSTLVYAYQNLKFAKMKLEVSVVNVPPVFQDLLISENLFVTNPITSEYWKQFDWNFKKEKIYP